MKDESAKSKGRTTWAITLLAVWMGLIGAFFGNVSAVDYGSVLRFSLIASGISSALLLWRFRLSGPAEKGLRIVLLLVNAWNVAQSAVRLFH
jgi:hypothetical protein